MTSRQANGIKESPFSTLYLYNKTNTFIIIPFQTPPQAGAYICDVPVTSITNLWTPLVNKEASWSIDWTCVVRITCWLSPVRRDTELRSLIQYILSFHSSGSTSFAPPRSVSEYVFSRTGPKRNLSFRRDRSLTGDSLGSYQGAFFWKGRRQNGMLTY